MRRLQLLRVRSLFTQKSGPDDIASTSPTAPNNGNDDQVGDGAVAASASAADSPVPTSPSPITNPGLMLKKLRKSTLLNPFTSPDGDGTHGTGDTTTSTTVTNTAQSGVDRPLAPPQRSATTNVAQPHASAFNSTASLGLSNGATIPGLPELDPVLRFLQLQAKKVYREGYLLKLDDLDINGQPCTRRDWAEYYVRLTGTVLSFWSTASLPDPPAASAAADNITELTSGPPALYMNLADASLKILDSLATTTNSTSASGDNGNGSTTLQNILSLSTAGRNRFLLHFSARASLTLWAAAIRLSIFEYALLQESYTGALIAGKGKYVNGLRQVLGSRTKFAHGEWARVRFRPGTPWVRCWCVVEPPSEKDVARMKKEVKKRRRSGELGDDADDGGGAYAKGRYPCALGSLLFFEDEKKAAKKKKKQTPIARLTDAWMAYAVYPRGLELIDHSTLVKVHGMIDREGNASRRKSREAADGTGGPKSTEGSVFILPESRPAVPGYDTLIRFLIPLFDAFALYGRPTRLIPDPTNTRSLMFALGCHRKFAAATGASLSASGASGASNSDDVASINKRTSSGSVPSVAASTATTSAASSRSGGYLDVQDVSALLQTAGNQAWSEQDWMRSLKNLTAKKMNLMQTTPNMLAHFNQTHQYPYQQSSAAASSAASRVGGSGLRGYGSSPAVSFVSQAQSQSQSQSQRGTPAQAPTSAPMQTQPQSRHYRAISETLSEPPANEDGAAASAGLGLGFGEQGDVITGYQNLAEQYHDGGDGDAELASGDVAVLPSSRGGDSAADKQTPYVTTLMTAAAAAAAPSSDTSPTSPASTVIPAPTSGLAPALGYVANGSRPGTAGTSDTAGSGSARSQHPSESHYTQQYQPPRAVRPPLHQTPSVQSFHSAQQQQPPQQRQISHFYIPGMKPPGASSAAYSGSTSSLVQAPAPPRHLPYAAPAHAQLSASDSMLPESLRAASSSSAFNFSRGQVRPSLGPSRGSGYSQAGGNVASAPPSRGQEYIRVRDTGRLHPHQQQQHPRSGYNEPLPGTATYGTGSTATMAATPETGYGPDQGPAAGYGYAYTTPSDATLAATTASGQSGQAQAQAQQRQHQRFESNASVVDEHAVVMGYAAPLSGRFSALRLSSTALDHAAAKATDKASAAAWNLDGRGHGIDDAAGNMTRLQLREEQQH
ncbi:hypothetical protein KEM52_005066 [Ascosphaera acerosa]|nr:hypothetical protein KEM52_005066 [Ascosphaera acerosa]